MERVVLRLMCDDRGEISFLFGPWGAVDRDKAIRQIESGHRSYTLQRSDGSRAPIDVVDTGAARRLAAFTQGAEVLHHGDAVRLGA
jgi:hypothetical protein